MEHSRLLKFLLEELNRNKMADKPETIPDSETSNIKGEVPKEQIIREVTDIYIDGTGPNTSIEVSDTYSPVITVTKNETTLTKGDMKLQKVTVTEDIAGVHCSNSYKIQFKKTNMANEESFSQEVFDKEDTYESKKKTKIPQLKFRQTAERIRMDKRQVAEKPRQVIRNSSIPKLKDSKVIKTENYKEPEVKLEDEFDKIYEAIVDNKDKEVEIKIAAEKVDDVEKIETKFEEIIHAYDHDEDSYLQQIEKLKLQRLARRSRGEIVSLEKTKNETSDTSKLRDGGFKITANTINIKRLSRGSSLDLSNIHTQGTNETNGALDNKQDNKASVTSDTVEDVSVRDDSLSEHNVASITRHIEIANEINNITNEINNRSKITETTVNKPTIKTWIPKKITTTRDVNTSRDAVRDKFKKDDNKADFIKKTVNNESANKTENVSRITSISRRYSRDGKSITLTPKAKDNQIKTNDKPTESDTITNQNSNENEHLKPDVKVLTTEKTTRESIKIGIPVFVKTTNNTVENNTPVKKATNYVRSQSENKISNTFTNKAHVDDLANELKAKRFSRSYSEIIPKAKPTVTSINNETTVLEKEVITKQLNNNDVNDNEKHVQRENGIPNDSKTDVNDIQNDKEKKKITDNDEVKVLRGNVSRLIRQISVKEKKNVPKKESNAEEELPRKKTVLSKIAMFEYIQPAANSLAKMRQQIKIKENKALNIKKDERKPKIVDHILKVQPQENIVSEINKDQTNVRDEVEDAVNVTEEVQEYIEKDILVQENNDVHDNEIKPEDRPDINETDALEDESINGNEILIANEPAINQNTITDTQHQPENNDENVELPITIVNKYINVFEKVEELNDNTADQNKPKRVGKINLNLWQKKVESNKQPLVPKRLTDKAINEVILNVRDKAAPEEIVIKTDQQIIMPTILPPKINLVDDVTPNDDPISPIKANFEASEGHLQVPLILPQTPLTKRDFSDNFLVSDEIIDILDESIGANDEEKTEKTIKYPSENGFKVEPYKMQSPEIVAGIIQFTKNYQKEKTQILSSNVEFEPIPKDFSDTLPEYNEAVEQNLEILKDSNNIIESLRDVEDFGILSPDLIDSDTEINEPKETKENSNVMKKKIYYIAKTGSIKNYEEETMSFNVNTIENEPKIEEDNNHNSLNDFEVEEVNEMKSLSEIEKSKSLAELDLGEAVIGKVQKMLHRIKSVDFDKKEPPVSRKISVREMPRRCTVLERIALFEGRRTNATDKPEISELSATRGKAFEKIANASVKPNTKEISIDEIYLQKVDKLSSAKMKYGTAEAEYLSLGNGEEMPALALGTAVMDSRLTPHVVAAAIDLGFRAIDTAYIYGNERLVGEGIKKKLDDGSVTREDLYIISKLWSTFHDPALVEGACRSSLEALGLEYFDLFLIHNPMSFKEGGDPIPKIAGVVQFSKYNYLDAWHAMEKLVSIGLVKSIGVSNFNSKQVQRILDKGRIRPVINQVECHPYLTQQRLQAFCSERNITLSCYGVLGSKGTPAEYKSGVPAAIDNPLIKDMASELNITPAQLLVRYQLQLGRQVVVKSATPGHLWDILNTTQIDLDQNHIVAINALNLNKRIFTFKGMGETHKNYPFREQF